jgi:type IX secretion system PorP/SprF family membrane protein
MKSTKNNKSTMQSKISTFILGSCVAIGISTAVHAQDIHFSQMAFSPLNLNPAMAGAHSPMQAIVNYRNQWRSVASPYSTINASFDARLNENKRYKKGYLAAGVNFFNDKSGDAKISTTTGLVNVAYHILLDGNSTLGASIYGGFGQRSFDPTAGKWGSQYDGMAYNPLLSSGETFGRQNFTYGDFGMGALYTKKLSSSTMTSYDSKEITAGLALYHLNRPSYSFIVKNDDRLYMRWSMFVNATLGIENSKYSFMPAIYYQRQGKAQELLLGSYVRYMVAEASQITGFNQATYLSFGLFYRNRDALALKTMLEWGDYTVGFAYDVNVSSLSQVSNARGGFEIFLRYRMLGGLNGNRARIN